MKSRSVKLSFILLIGLLLAGTLLLIACGGGSTTTTTAPSTQTSTSQPVPGSTDTSGTTATSAAGTPKYGGTLRIAAPTIGANVGWPAAMGVSGTLVTAYYETLFHSDAKGNLIPWLAESYKVADDQKSITFTIRKGVKFSDGSDLTAEVVKWNLEQEWGLTSGAPAGGPSSSLPAGGPPASLPAGGPPASLPAGGSPTPAPAGSLSGASSSNWTSVEVVDPYTVRVNFKTWSNTTPGSFGTDNPALFMVSKAAYDANGQDWMTTHPVGTGPFTLVSYSTDATAKLVKNPNYWAKDAQGNKLPYLDGLEFTFTADATTELMMAKADEVDMIVSLSAGKQTDDYKNIGWRTNVVYDSTEVWAPDSAHPDSPWSKLEVREAAEYAIDRATIAEKFGYGYLAAPYQIPPRNTTANDPNFTLGRTYDPAKAKQLLAQAGYPNGFKTTLIIFPGGNHDIALAEQAYLAAVGIQADLQFPDFGKWNSIVGPQGTYNNALVEGPDPGQGPTGLGCVTFGLFLYGNSLQKPPEFTQALSAALSSPTPDGGLVRATTDVLTKNALLIPVYELASARVEQPFVVVESGTRGLTIEPPVETAWLNK